MFIADSAPSRWSELNSQIREALALEGFSGSVTVFQTPYQAILETVLSLSQLYSHKPEMLMPVESAPHWRNLAADGTRLGLRSHLAPTAQIANLITQKVNKKNLLMAWQAMDDPILGQQYACEWMQPLLAEKIFCVKLKYNFDSGDIENIKNISPFEGFIFVLAPGLSVAVFGDRIKMVPFVAPNGYWSDAVFELAKSVSSKIREASAKDPEKIKDFERNSVSLGGQALIQTEARSWDRAWVTFSSLDGSALRDFLIEQNSSYQSSLETLSPCRWPLTKKFDWLYEQGFSPTQLRGSLMVGLELLSKKEFWTDLTRAIDQMKQIQGNKV